MASRHNPPKSNRNRPIRSSKIKQNFCAYCRLALQNLTSSQSSKTGCMYDWFSWIYQERKFVASLLIHFVLTLLVWQHFFFEKWLTTREELSSDTNKYHLKLWAPSVIYAIKHAILFQMALLPVTMSRQLIVRVSRTSVQSIVPMEKMVEMHIYVGYTMIILTVLAPFGFFGYLGTLCKDEMDGREPMVDGQKVFCDKLTSEIMFTGLGITAITILVAVTSYLRSRFPYEVFYFVHNFVFLIFGLAIIHTLDDKYRAGQQRSQDYKWVSGSLAVYIIDRVYMKLNGESMSVMEAKALGDGKSKVSILRIQKPIAFHFESGQYAFLRISDLDKTWHPFFIGSSTLEPTLDFYIEGFGDDTWTGKLWQLIRKNSTFDEEQQQYQFTVDVLGPYGTGFTDLSTFRHLVLVGSGTGVVPLISVLKTYYQKLYSINDGIHRLQVQQMVEVSKECFRANSQSLQGMIPWTFLQRYFGNGTSKTSGKEESELSMLAIRLQQIYRIANMKKYGQKGATYKALLQRQQSARRNEWSTLFFILLPVGECVICGLAISWQCLDQDGLEIGSRAEKVFAYLNLVLLLGFVVAWSCCQILTFRWYCDFSVILATIITDAILLKQQHFSNENLLTVSIVLLSSYRLIRMWYQGVVGNTSSLQSVLSQKQQAIQVSPVDTIKLVWSNRGTSLPAYLWEDLNQFWSELTARYGEYTQSVASINIYITQCGKKDFKTLQNFVRDTELLNETGTLVNGRPNMPKILRSAVEDRMKEGLESMVGGSIGTASSTLVAFCGGTALGAAVKRDVMNLQTAGKALMGNSNHSLTFVQKTFGVASVKKSARKPRNLQISRIGSQHVGENIEKMFSNIDHKFSLKLFSDLDQKISELDQKLRSSVCAKSESVSSPLAVDKPQISDEAEGHICI